MAVLQLRRPATFRKLKCGSEQEMPEVVVAVALRGGVEAGAYLLAPLRGVPAQALAACLPAGFHPGTVTCFGFGHQCQAAAVSQRVAGGAQTGTHTLVNGQCPAGVVGEREAYPGEWTPGFMRLGPA